MIELTPGEKELYKIDFNSVEKKIEEHLFRSQQSALADTRNGTDRKTKITDMTKVSRTEVSPAELEKETQKVESLLWASSISTSSERAFKE